MPMGKCVRSRRVVAVGIAVVVSFGVGGCSFGSDKRDSKKPNASASSSEKATPEWEDIAEKAMVGPDLPALHDHEPDADGPWIEALGEIPLSSCAAKKAESVTVKATASWTFEGDPPVTSFGYAVDDSAEAAFKKLRDIWKSKKCKSFTSEVDGVKMKLNRVNKIEAPKGVAEESWFGACYESLSGSGTISDSGSYFALSAYCEVLFVSSEYGISAVSGSYIAVPNVEGIPEDAEILGGGTSEQFVSALAMEAMDQ